MLVSDVLDRTYDEYLYPAGIQRPAWDKLAAPGIDANTLTIPLSGRVPNVPAGAILEIGSEAILADSVAGATVTAFERGWLETDNVAHATGAKVFVNPTYLRKTLFDGLNGLIGQFYPWGLYVRSTDSTQ